MNNTLSSKYLECCSVGRCAFCLSPSGLLRAPEKECTQESTILDSFSSFMVSPALLNYSILTT